MRTKDEIFEAVREAFGAFAADRDLDMELLAILKEGEYDLQVLTEEPERGLAFRFFKDDNVDMDVREIERYLTLKDTRQNIAYFHEHVDFIQEDINNLQIYFR